MDEQRMWWEELFQIHEFATYSDVAASLTNNEVDFLEMILNLTPDMRVLDLACGNGRHLLGLARRGYHVDGVELATPLVNQLSAQIAAEQLPARVIAGDMRKLDDLGMYDVVLIMNSSLGFFSDFEHQQLLNDLADHLVPQGRLVLQCINPYQIGSYMQHYRRGWHQVGPGYVLRESHFSPTTGTIETAYRYIEPNGGEAVHPGERIRLYTFPEWQQQVQRAGLRLQAVFGDAVLPIVPFDETSQWQILMAMK